MSALKLKSYDKYTKWIVNEDGTLVATIDALANGYWVVKKDGQRVDRRIHATPKAAFAFFTEVTS